jgi:hypothetical protein
MLSELAIPIGVVIEAEDDFAESEVKCLTPQMDKERMGHTQGKEVRHNWKGCAQSLLKRRIFKGYVGFAFPYLCGGKG